MYLLPITEDSTVTSGNRERISRCITNDPRHEYGLGSDRALFRRAMRSEAIS
jgi:hypothetical protein